MYTPAKFLLNNLRTEFVQRYPDFKITDHHKTEIIIKPKRGFGGWVTIFFGHNVVPMERYIRLRVDGYWCSASYEVLKEFRIYYGQYYLQHKMCNGKHVSCSEKSNTCLPDYKLLYSGRGGMWKEFFLEK